MFSRLDTIILRVGNIFEAKKWYEEKLELTSSFFDEEEKLAVLNVDENSSLTIWEIKADEKLVPATSSGCYPIFSVEDAAKAHGQLAKKGVKVGELTDGGGVIFFQFADPDGNTLEACQVLE